VSRKKNQPLVCGLPWQGYLANGREMRNSDGTSVNEMKFVIVLL
jgi:hypothetical protein